MYIYTPIVNIIVYYVIRARKQRATWCGTDFTSNSNFNNKLWVISQYSEFSLVVSFQNFMFVFAA